MTLLLAALTAAAAADAQPAAEDCPSTAAQVAAALADTFAAANRRDTPGYQTARDRTFTRLACLTEVLSPEVAADVHVVLAVDAVGPGDTETLSGALRAYALLRPNAPLANRLKMSSKMRAADDAVQRAEPGPTAPLPSGGRFWLDGREATSWPTDRTAVLQAQALDESARLWTTTLRVGGPLPAVPAWALPRAESEAAKNKRAGWWWAATGASAAAAGGLWWGALQERAAFRAYEEQVAQSGPLPERQRQEVDATAARANQLGRVAQIFSGVTAGLTTVALVVTF